MATDPATSSKVTVTGDFIVLPLDLFLRLVSSTPTLPVHPLDDPSNVVGATESDGYVAPEEATEPTSPLRVAESLFEDAPGYDAPVSGEQIEQRFDELLKKRESNDAGTGAEAAEGHAAEGAQAVRRR